MSTLSRLSSKHGELLSDIAKMQRQKDSQSRQAMMEISRLKRYRDKVAVEVKKLLLMLSELRGGKEAIESSLKGFSDETVVLVSQAAKGVLRDYAGMKVQVSEEMAKTSADRAKISNLSTFLHHKEKELDNLSVGLAQREEKVKRDDKLVSEAQMDIAMKEVRIATQLRDAERKYKEAEAKLKEADAVLKQSLEGGQARLAEEVDRLRKASLREAKVKAGEDNLRIWENRLNNKEKLLKDRDLAINRKARELKIVI